MMILSRRAKDRIKVSLLHGGSKIKATIGHEAEWQLLRDRLDASVSDALFRFSESEQPRLFHGDEAPTAQLSFTCDLSHVTDEREFEESLTTIHRVMSQQHPNDVRLLVLVSSKLRASFDSIEWAHREACAKIHNVTLALLGHFPQSINPTERER